MPSPTGPTEYEVLSTVTEAASVSAELERSSDTIVPRFAEC